MADKAVRGYGSIKLGTDRKLGRLWRPRYGKECDGEWEKDDPG